MVGDTHQHILSTTLFQPFKSWSVATLASSTMKHDHCAIVQTDEINDVTGSPVCRKLSQVQKDAAQRKRLQRIWTKAKLSITARDPYTTSAIWLFCCFFHCTLKGPDQLSPVNDDLYKQREKEVWSGRNSYSCVTETTVSQSRRARYSSIMDQEVMWPESALNGLWQTVTVC